MAITRSGGCQEVCQEVRNRLGKADLINPQEIKHGPVFEGLEKCVIVRKEDLAQLFHFADPGNSETTVLPEDVLRRLKAALQ